SAPVTCQRRERGAPPWRRDAIRHGEEGRVGFALPPPRGLASPPASYTSHPSRRLPAKRPGPCPAAESRLPLGSAPCPSASALCQWKVPYAVSVTPWWPLPRVRRTVVLGVGNSRPSNAAITSSVVGRAPPFFACAFSHAIFSPNSD